MIVLLIFLTILYIIEVILHEKDKKRLKEIKRRYGED